MPNILILHGPNLNLLGQREAEIYGFKTLSEINHSIESLATDLGHKCHIFQSNAEHLLIEKIHECGTSSDFIIINPAGFTHTSIALRDALTATNKNFIEVHLSNIHQREPFRQHSYFSDIAKGVITGLGPMGYLLALRYAHHYLKTHDNRSNVPSWTCEKLES